MKGGPALREKYWRGRLLLGPVNTKNASRQRFLAPKFHLGAFPAPAKFHFAPTPAACRGGIGNEIASTSAFPSETWERGTCAPLELGHGAGVPGIGDAPLAAKV